jgi:large subunit ribosomal protein L35
LRPGFLSASEFLAMPKNKNHKGLQKRMRVTKTGKIRHRSANHKHLRSGKGGKRLRQLRKDPYMSSADAKRLEKLLFRRLRGRNQPRTAIRRSPSPAERKAMRAEKAAAAAKKD